jgi:predicted enzyme related to lactoylglutathione lyase
MSNGFVHLELTTNDVNSAKDFYQQIFNWKVTDIPEMGYTLFDAGKGAVGGGFTKPMMPNQPTGWLAYVEVSSVKDTVERAERAGAHVMVPFQQIGEMGAIGVFTDPNGAPIGVWEKGKTEPKRQASARKTTKKATKRSTKSRATSRSSKSTRARRRR